MYIRAVLYLPNGQFLRTLTPVFRVLEDNRKLFSEVYVDTGGYGIVWNDDLDLSCDELFADGKIVKSPFDGLIAFTDATELWA